MSFRTSQTGSSNAAPKLGGNPRPAVGGARTGGIRKRPTASGGAVSRGGTSGLLSFYTEDAPGLKIGPTVVLVMSLLFIAFVILLHIWGKFNR